MEAAGRITAGHAVEHVLEIGVGFAVNQFVVVISEQTMGPAVGATSGAGEQLALAA